MWYRSIHCFITWLTRPKAVDDHCYGRVVMSLRLFLPIQAANTFIMHLSNQVSDSWPDLQDKTSLTLYWRSFSEWCRERVAFCFDYKGGLYLICECLLPITTQVTQDAGRKIVDTPLTFIFRIEKTESVSFSWIERWPEHQKQTLIYQSQYIAINSRISECDHK